MNDTNDAVEKITECPQFYSINEYFQDYFQHEKFKKFKQLAITSKNGNDLFDGVGSLYDYEKGEFIAATDEYTTLNEIFLGTPVVDLYKIVQQLVSDKYNLKIGRVRLMRLEPRSCYTYHRDPDEFRFHLPLKSNDKCFFIVENAVHRMKELFTLYKLRTNLYHTAVNASQENRDHLVFDTYK